MKLTIPLVLLVALSVGGQAVNAPILKPVKQVAQPVEYEDGCDKGYQLWYLWNGEYSYTQQQVSGSTATTGSGSSDWNTAHTTIYAYPDMGHLYHICVSDAEIKLLKAGKP